MWINRVMKKLLQISTQGIRGTYWEVVRCKVSPDTLAKSECAKLAKKYGLYYVTD